MSIFRTIVAAVIAGAVALPAVAQTAAEVVPPQKILADGFKTLADLTTELDKRAANVAVTVDGTPITDGDISDENKTYPASFGRMSMTAVYQIAMENLMRQRALALRARREGVDKDPAAMRRLAIGTDRILVAEYMRREITPKLTEPALRARYEKQYAGKPGPLEMRARVIAMPTREEAMEVLSKLRANPDFAAVAREFSRDASAPVGGDLGYVPIEAIDPALGAALFAMNPGEMTSNPVKGAQGWFLIRNEGARQQASPTYESVREQLRREMVAEEMAAIRAAIPAKITAEPGKTPSVETEKAK